MRYKGGVPIDSQVNRLTSAERVVIALALAAACTPSAERSAGLEPAPEAASGNEAAAGPEAVPAYVQRAVDAPDREEADRALDTGRHPKELLVVFGVAPGMRVGEIASGGGYTAELLARVVGAEGEVHGQNSEFILDRFARAPWEARLAKPVMAPVVRHDRPFEDPFGPDVHGLDLVVNVLFYHDTFWQNVDREAMNRAIFAALRPGGRYVIVDHAAAEGRGAAVTRELHRVEESLVVDDVTRAGFRLVGESDLLRVPSDTRDWNASPSAAADRRGTSDRFILIFERP
jgi:predicted methyltransferase